MPQGLKRWSEAHQYFFVKICEYAIAAHASGHGKSDYEVFAKERNQSANGKDQYLPLGFSLHMPRLGRNSTMFELLEKLHQTRWSLHLRVVIFSNSLHPIARISDWFCSLYTTSKRYH